MTSAIQVIEQINEQLTCAICLDRLTSPLFLQCLHTFCSQCLHRIVNNDPVPVITCPTCRAETPLPEKGVDQLMSNFFVNQMLDLVYLKSEELKKEIRENKKCAACDNVKTADFATSRCVDCNKDLCTSCVAEHKRAHATLDHRIIATGEDDGQDTQELDKYCLSFCKYHTRNVIKYFCNTCDEAICRVCTILEHREHQYVYPKEALPGRRGAITELLEQAKSRMPQLKKTLAEVREMSKRLTECKEAITREISENTQARIEALREGQNDLLKQLDDIHTAKQKVLCLQKDSIELELGKLSGCCEFADNVMKFGNEVEILQMKGRLETLNDVKVNFEPEEDDTIQYVNDPATTKIVSESLGSIRASSTFASISFASGDGIHTARVKMETTFKLTTKDRHGQRQQGGDRVTVDITQPDGTGLPATVKDEGMFEILILPSDNTCFQYCSSHHFQRQSGEFTGFERVYRKRPCSLWKFMSFSKTKTK